MPLCICKCAGHVRMWYSARVSMCVLALVCVHQGTCHPVCVCTGHTLVCACAGPVMGVACVSVCTHTCVYTVSGVCPVLVLDCFCGLRVSSELRPCPSPASSSFCPIFIVWRCVRGTVRVTGSRVCHCHSLLICAGTWCCPGRCWLSAQLAPVPGSPRGRWATDVQRCCWTAA